MKKILLFTLIALVGGIIAQNANAHEFKSERMKNWYGSAVAYVGWHGTLNTAVINSGNLQNYPYSGALDTELNGTTGNTLTIAKTAEEHLKANGETENYKHVRNLMHEISVGVQYNLYYRGLSKTFHPFIGGDLKFNIPTMEGNWSSIAKEWNTKTYNESDLNNHDNYKQFKYGMRHYNVFTGVAKVGLRINIADNFAIAPYAGYGKTLTLSETIERSYTGVDNINVAVNSSDGKVYNISFDKNGGIKYGDDTRKTISKLNSPTLHDTVVLGVDTFVKISNQTFLFGMEYMHAQGLNEHATQLTAKIGYQFF